jgi:hypothetical protein
LGPAVTGDICETMCFVFWRNPPATRRLVESGAIKGKKLGHDWVVLTLNYKRRRKPKTQVVKQKGGS